ncbi:MAG: FAD:protein FMN transferase [Clostridium sp.]|nr:FAD:protein FMN transferase [Clostridium sp.]
MKITFFSLGTMNTITVFELNCEEVLNIARKRVIEIDNRMSAFKEDSDVMRINRSAGVKGEKINKDTFEVLKRALEFSRLSKGSFDITIRPLTSLWGIGKKKNFVPSKDEIEKRLKLVNYNDLHLDDKKVEAYLRKEGQTLDLGGIAKGYAADEVRRILLQHNIKNALINLGGNIVAMGYNSLGEPWRIGIQNPLSPRGEHIGTVKVTNKTIVTSGSNEQFFIKDGIRYHHIINPNTGYPANTGILSVTVLCEDSIDADAVTTALFVQDINESIPLLKSINAEAIFVMENEDIFATEGLIHNFERS